MDYGFQTPLIAQKVKEAHSTGRAGWRLREDLVYLSEQIGMLIVPAGFETDFSSVPRMPFAYWLAGDTAHASAVVHDYLCRVWYPAMRISWVQAAKVFDEAMQHEGVPGWRRWLMSNIVAGADPARTWEPSS